MKVIVAKNQNDIDLCLKIRRTVFIEEQNVPEELEIDEFDTFSASCIHFMIYDEDNLIGTFRIISEKQNEAHLQRFCILKEYRGRDFGKNALQCADAFCLSNGYSRITLNSQCHAIKFYEKSGYTVVSDVFDDAGIPHVTMIKELDTQDFQKKKQLFLNQKELLDTFLNNHAITQAQYNKSYGDLKEKMNMQYIGE